MWSNKNEKQRKEYNRLVRNVKRTLPIAKEVNRAIIETYEYLQTLPNDKSRENHLKLVEKSIKDRIHHKDERTLSLNLRYNKSVINLLLLI